MSPINNPGNIDKSPPPVAFFIVIAYLYYKIIITTLQSINPTTETKSQNTMDSFEDIDFSEIISIIALGAVDEAKRSKKSKTTGLPGAEYLRELLECENEKRIYEVLRMQKDTFNQLCIRLRRAGLKDSRYILIDQQVAMFLWVLNYSASIQATAERFQHSSETISR